MLTFSAGVVDAVGFLGLDRVFIGNMTGNVMLLGMGLTGAAGLPVLRPSLALIFFILGAAFAGRALHKSPREAWSPKTTATLLAIAIAMTAVSITTAVVDVHGHEALGSAVTSLLALVMGMQAVTARGLRVVDVTTVVVTSTITGLAADSSLAGGNNTNWIRRVLAIVLILFGALAGAAALQVGLWLGLAVSSALTFAVTCGVGHSKHRSEPEVVPINVV